MRFLTLLVLTAFIAIINAADAPTITTGAPTTNASAPTTTVAGDAHPGWVLPTLVVELLLVFVASIWWFKRGVQPVSDWASLSAVVGTRTGDPAELALLTSQQLDGRQSWAGPKALAAGRCAVFAFMLGVVVFNWSIKGITRGLRFFTVWNYYLQLVFFGLASFCSVAYTSKREVPQGVLTVTAVLYQVCVPVSVLVSMLTWGVLLPQATQAGDAEQLLNFVSYCMHAVNCVCLLLEFYFGRLLLHSWLYVVVVAWMGGYIGFAWIYHANTQWYAYFFLELTAVAPIWYTGCVLLSAGVFFTFVGFSHCKKPRLQRGDLREYTAIHSL